MKNLLCILAILAAPLLSTAQSLHRTISEDSIKAGYELEGGWRYHDGDNPAWALQNYNDSGWSITNSTIRSFGKKKQPFSGIGWFRQSVVFDTSIVGYPLALLMRHDGASEVYLDGKLIKRNGVIAPPDSTKVYDPARLPFVFVPLSAGLHLLAVRYADPEAAAEWKDHSISATAGLELSLHDANAAVYRHSERSTSRSVLLISLISIFGTIAIIHFILFLYQRSVRSNALFALFTLTVSLDFLVAFLAMQAGNFAVKIAASWALPYITILSCISLSGFINALFGRAKWHFLSILGVGLLAAALVPFSDELSAAVTALLGFLVFIEIAVLVISAVRRRVPGARIVATGVLAFPVIVIVIILTAVVLGFTNSHVAISGTLAGALFSILLLSGVLAIPLAMSAYLAWNFAAMSKRLKAELTQVEALSEKSRQQEEEKQRLLQTRQEELEREVSLRTGQLRAEKQKSDDLLLNILPEEVADELKEKGHAQARLHDDVSVIFTDFVDFTRYSERLSPAQIVDELDNCFKAFDAIIERHGLEKIKTIGDAYMAVAGLPLPHPDGATASVRAALDILNYIRQRRAQNPDTFDIRIGVHSGPVVAGIIGVKKFAYDVWGDTVNTASRMEQCSEAGRVNISAATHALIRNAFVCSYRGEVTVKGKGAMGIYFVGKAIREPSVTA